MRALWAPVTYAIATFFVVTIVIFLVLKFLLGLMEPHTENLWWLPAAYGNGIGMFAAGFVGARMSTTEQRSRKIFMGVASAMLAAIIGTFATYRGDLIGLYPYALVGIACSGAGAVIGSRVARRV